METVALSLGSQIRERLAELSNGDGLKRTQRWLSGQIGIGEVELSNKISSAHKAAFTQAEIDSINKILRTDFKL